MLALDSLFFWPVFGQNERSFRRKTAGSLIETIGSDELGTRARYIRITAKNVATIPAGHRAAGLRAWLFVDEILINPVVNKPSRE